MNADERKTAKIGLYRILTLFAVVFASINILYGLGLVLRPTVDIGVIKYLVETARVSHGFVAFGFFSSGIAQLFVKSALLRFVCLFPHVVYAGIGAWYIITNDHITLIGVSASVVIIVMAMFLIWLEHYVHELLKVIDG